MPAVGPQASSSLQSELYPGNAVAVTLTADFPFAGVFVAGFARELIIGGAGNLAVVHYLDANTQVVTFPVTAGQIIKGMFSIVKSTTNGTTATGIIARY